MCCRYVGTVRLRVEGVVGSLSDASATLSELCFTRAFIPAPGAKCQGQQTARFPRARSTALNSKAREESSREIFFLGTPFDASLLRLEQKNFLSGPRGATA